MDSLDNASELEQLHRSRSLAHQRTAARSAKVAQCIVDGEVLCLDCGDAVPLGRLNAQPDAAYCIDCQSMREAKWKR